MGKQSAQRTKKNLKPSNSLRSAEILSTSLGDAAIKNFIGFGGISSNEKTEVSDSSDIGLNVDNDFDLTLRQMFKKDSTTKIKSLSKFSEYCDTKDLNIVKLILPKWAKMFNKLAFDNDFRVREACFQAHKSLVTKVGKEIAPFLKQMISPWFLCLHDPYAITASAAKSSFDAAFSPDKQPKALTFCQEVILNSCRNIILNCALEDKSITNDEERKAKQDRLLFCSISGLSNLLSIISTNKTLCDSIDELLKDEMFWKLEKNKDISIRSAWYKLKSSICENVGNVTHNYSKKFTITTFAHIQERDTLLVMSIWNNILWIAITIPNFWTYINLQKSFFPKLKALVCNGPTGFASSIYPSLLPILAKIPIKELVCADFNFIKDLIDSLESRLLKELPYSQDFAAICKAYFEIILFFLTNDETIESIFTSKEYLCNMFSSTIDSLLNEWKDIYCWYFSEFISFIEKLTNKELQLNCVSIIETVNIKLIQKSKEDPSKLTNVTLILQTILRHKYIKISKKVKFKQTDQDYNETNSNVKPNEIFKQSLSSIWMNLLEIKPINNNKIWLKQMSEIHKILLLSGFHPIILTDENFENYLKSLIDLQLYSRNEENLAILIEIAFRIFDFQKNFSIIEYCSHFKEPKAMTTIFEQLEKRLDTLKNILEDEKFGHLFLTCAKMLIESCENEFSEKESFSHFLQICFKIDFENACMLNELFDILKNSLNKNAFIVCEISKNLFINYRKCFLLNIQDLILKLFSMSCDVCFLTNKKMVDILIEVWEAGVNSLNDNKELIINLGKLFKEFLINKVSNNDSVEQLKKISLKLVHLYSKHNKISDAELFKCMLLSSNEWLSQLSDEFPLFLWLKTDLLLPNQLDSFDKIIDTKFIYPVKVVMDLYQWVIREYNILPDIFNEQIPFIYLVWSVMNYASTDWKFENKEYLVEIDKFLNHHMKNLDLQTIETIKLYFTNSLMPNRCFLLLGFARFLELSKSQIQLDFDIKKTNYDSICKIQLLYHYLDENFISHLFEEALLHLISCEDLFSYKFCTFFAIINTSIKVKRININFQNIVHLFDFIIGLKKTNENLFLFKWSESLKNEQFILPILIINFFNNVIENFFPILPDKFFDLILISLTSWMVEIKLSSHILENIYFTVFISRILILFLTIDSKISLASKRLHHEWSEFHLVKISKALVSLLLCLHDLNFKNYQLMVPYLLRKCLKSSKITLSTFDDIEIKFFELIDAPVYPLKDKECSIFTELNKIIINNNSAFYLSSYLIIQELLYLLFHCKETSLDPNMNLLAPPLPLFCTLKETDLIVDTMLVDYEIGDICIIKPGTDSYKYTIGYLLNWMSILNFFSHLSIVNKSLLSHFLMEMGFISRLMNNLFRLLPVRMDAKSKEDVEKIRSILISGVDNLDNLNQDEGDIPALTYIVYYNVLKKIPASLRVWWNNLNKTIAIFYNDFTVVNMSELIIIDELKAVQNADLSNYDGLMVKTRNSAKEVVAYYTVEEKSIELTIKLPDNHPLGTISIDVGKCFIAKDIGWRTWLLQLNSFLTYQNGSIIDGLLLLKRNIDKKFNALEECVICFHKLYGPGFKAPELSCKTCKKKFHSGCLYTWFKERNNLTCPLCRSQM